MIPNFIWFAVPAPNDILRVNSITVIFDTIAFYMPSINNNCFLCLKKSRA